MANPSLTLVFPRRPAGPSLHGRSFINVLIILSCVVGFLANHAPVCQPLSIMDTTIKSLGPCTIDTPLKQNGHVQDFASDCSRVLFDDSLEAVQSAIDHR